MSGDSPVSAAGFSQSATAPDPVAGPIDGPPEGACPPPLVWQEVLRVYLAESQPWELDRGSRRLVGRTWGQGPPLYLLNGFAATGELYALLVYLLRDTFRCIVFDTVWNGGVSRPRPTLGDFAGDLLAAIEHQGDRAANVYGPTFGAAVALAAALQAPDRISALILQHGFARRRLSWVERLLAAWCRRSRRLLQDLPWRRRVQLLNHRQWFPPFDETRFEFLVQSTGTIPLADLADRARAVDRAELQTRLSEVACPVLLVQTEGEGALESAGHDALQRGLRDCRSERLHSTGLHPYLTHPHRLAKILKSFLLAEPANSG